MFDPRLIDRQEALRVARRLTRDLDRAEDLVQDALLRAIQNREQYRDLAGSGSARGWFYHLMRNVYISQQRRPRLDPTQAPAWACDRAIAMDDAVDHDRIVNAIHNLPEWARSVLTARSIGQSYQEIADAYHVPIGTIMSRLFRARALLHIA